MVEVKIEGFEFFFFCFSLRFSPPRRVLTADRGGDVPCPFFEQSPISEDGTVNVAYKPQAEGPLKVHVTVNGQPIANSPFIVEAKKGSFADAASERPSG
jgi:hypothetical protein